MVRYLLALWCALAFLIAIPPADAQPKDKPKEKPKEHKKHKANRLARESSPYLLQHAHNPVDWFPWGQEAFDKAKKENKLVFLSVGYSSCHWCHVMEKESFADEEVAKILNDGFICIKVDREERPDVDQIYMTALNVLGNSGGWPLSMFLDAQGRPIVGFTYRPKEDREIDGEKINGFKTLLDAIQKFQRKQPKELDAQAEKVAKATQGVLQGLVRGLALVELDRKLVDAITEGLREEFDKTHGGFGNPENKFRGPKFPRPSTLMFLRNEAKRGKLNAEESKELAGMVDLTLDRMARGGIYDHLGGGFHRYTVERTWTVPHFEKMLYDNAQLLELYADAYADHKKLAYKRVLEQTIAFIAREMTDSAGGFYSALDADSEGEEGKFYVWTAQQVAAVITDRDDLRLFRKAYGCDEGYNFESSAHIFRLPIPLTRLAEEEKTTEEKLEARLAGIRKRLFESRGKRPSPFLDKKVLTAWNGQMIAGLSKAAMVLEDKNALGAARKAADFILATMRDKNGRLKRSYAAAPGGKAEARLNGYLDDYTFLVHGLLTLHTATKEKRWLTEAVSLTETMTKFHGDDKIGGFYYTSHDHEKLFARAKDQFDGAQPAGNSMAASNLVRLWLATKDEKYSKQAEKSFRSLASALKTNPTGLTQLGDALATWLAHQPAEEKKK